MTRKNTANNNNLHVSDSLNFNNFYIQVNSLRTFPQHVTTALHTVTYSSPL